MTSVDFAQPEQGYDLDGVSTDSERAGTACQPRRIGNVLDLRVPTEGTCGIDSSLNLFLKEAQNFLSFSPKDLLFGIPDQADVDLCDRQVQTLTLSNFNGLADDAEVDIVLGISPRALPSGTTPPSTDGGPSSLVDGSLPSGDSAVAPVVCRASTSGTSSLFSWDPAVRTWEPPVVLTETFRGYVRNSQLIVDVPEDASRPLPLFVKYGLVSLQGGYIVTDLREGDVFKKLSTQEPLRDATRLRMNGIMTSTMAMPAVLAIFRNYRLNDVARAVACDYADMPFRPLTGKLGTDERCQGVSVTMHVSLVAVRTAGALTTPPDLTYMPIAAADESACAP
jgi:hypothetical protein